MGFLLAQIAGLLLLAAALGAALMHWWLRRHFVDVSNEYSHFERMRKDYEATRGAKAESDARAATLAGEIRQLTGRLEDESKWRSELMPRVEDVTRVDLGPVTSRLTSVESLVAGLRPTDLKPVEERLSAVEAGLKAIRPADLAPLQAKVTAFESLVERDMGTLSTRVEALSGSVDNLRPADLSETERRLVSLEEAIERLSSGVAGFSVPDLDPIDRRIADVDGRVQSVSERLAGLRNTDLTDVDQRISAMDHTIQRLEARLGTLPRTDLGPVLDRLDAVEAALGHQSGAISSLALAARPIPTPPPLPSERAPKREPGANLLKSPTLGKPDDLKRISGVGPKLERMLHDAGVYYFWQVADWSAADVRHVDDLLEVFKGRIERDEWVRQAGGLATERGVARRPA